jgi:hypothetical protein
MKKSMMKSIQFSVLSLSLCSQLVAQKIIEVKKGEISSNNEKIASYDSKGGVFSANRYFWILANGSNDTLATINQINKDFENPLFESGLFYQVNFFDTKKTTYFMPNPAGWGAVGEKKIIGLVFNDKNPNLIEAGKISDAAVATLKSQGDFNYDNLLQSIKEVKEKTKVLHTQIIERDKVKPILQELTQNKKIITRIYGVERYADKQTQLLTQDDKKIGVYEKEYLTGSFAKTIYTIYKYVTPFAIDGKEITLLPIAYAEASPGITSTNTSTDIEIKIIADGSIIKIPPGPYNMSGSAILRALVDKNIL